MLALHMGFVRPNIRIFCPRECLLCISILSSLPSTGILHHMGMSDGSSSVSSTYHSFGVSIRGCSLLVRLTNILSSCVSLHRSSSAIAGLMRRVSVSDPHSITDLPRSFRGELDTTESNAWDMDIHASILWGDVASLIQFRETTYCIILTDAFSPYLKIKGLCELVSRIHSLDGLVVVSPIADSHDCDSFDVRLITLVRDNTMRVGGGSLINLLTACVGLHNISRSLLICHNLDVDAYWEVVMGMRGLNWSLPCSPLLPLIADHFH